MFYPGSNDLISRSISRFQICTVPVVYQRRQSFHFELIRSQRKGAKVSYSRIRGLTSFIIKPDAALNKSNRPRIPRFSRKKNTKPRNTSLLRVFICAISSLRRRTGCDDDDGSHHGARCRTRGLLLQFNFHLFYYIVALSISHTKSVQKGTKTKPF